MGTIASITKKFASYADGFNNEINKTVKDNENIIRELQLDQFASGLDNRGKPLSPNYDNDPYFAEKAANMNARQKVKTSAKVLSDAYKKWKWDIRPQAQLVPFPQRSISMPNLYINGTFWSTVYAKAVKDGWEIGGTWKQHLKWKQSIRLCLAYHLNLRTISFRIYLFLHLITT